MIENNFCGVNECSLEENQERGVRTFESLMQRLNDMANRHNESMNESRKYADERAKEDELREVIRFVCKEIDELKKEIELLKVKEEK